MTWKEFKEEVEYQGVRDHDPIHLYDGLSDVIICWESVEIGRENGGLLISLPDEPEPQGARA